MRNLCAKRHTILRTNLSAAAWAWPPKVIEMPEKPDLFKEELDQLSDQEIEARPAAAVWVDDKRAAVLRYLEEKKLGLKKAALSEKQRSHVAPRRPHGRPWK